MPRTGAAGPAARLICVTGMHRSGTSLAASAVQAAGVSFGHESSLLGPGPDNPAGYWENRSIKELDDELLARLGGSWDAPPVLVPGWELDLELGDLVARARDIVVDELSVSGTPFIGFKEPRAAVLLPFWRRAMPVAATVLVVRHPREVAASLAARNSLSAADAAALWLRYTFAALRDGPRPLIIRHDDLLTDLTGVLARVAAHIGLPAPDAEASARAEALLDRELVHHAAPDDGTEAEVDPLTALAELAWATPDLVPASFPAPLVEALAQGWVGPPCTREDLMAARAEAVDYFERLRRRHRSLRGATPGGS